jgi:O-6-methylguanine DNA methyltransferase
MKPSLYYTRFTSPLGPIGLFSTEKGVCNLTHGKRRFSDIFQKWAAATGREPAGGNRSLEQAAEELRSFLTGGTQTITIDIDLLERTPFQNRVLKILQEIPYGEVRSYQWVARHAGNGRACRAAGSACGANPVPIIIPCHRVIAKDGSLGGFSSGIRIKKWLLDLEHQQTGGMTPGRP